LRNRDELLEADRACDLADELTKLAPDALTAGAMDTITQRYHDAVGVVWVFSAVVSPAAAAASWAGVAGATPWP
jgi:hypothetical protein